MTIGELMTIDAGPVGFSRFVPVGTVPAMIAAAASDGCKVGPGSTSGAGTADPATAPVTGIPYGLGIFSWGALWPPCRELRGRSEPPRKTHSIDEPAFTLGD